MSGGILPQTDEAFQLLELKDPDAKGTSQQTLLQYKKCIQMCHCVKSVLIRSHSGRHFSRIFPHLD